MVKLFAPAMSLEATGTLAKAITFSQSKGRNYLRKRTTPTDPKSAPQLGTRAMFAFLAKHWTGLTHSQKTSWTDLANASTISTFNAYVAHNLSRWRLFQSPSKKYPPPLTGAVGTYVVEQPIAIGGVASIEISHIIDGVLNQNWGLLIFKGDTGFDTAPTNCVAAILSDVAMTEYAWLDTPLDPGTYYYNCRLFNRNGILGNEIGEISAAAT